jgi:hypothetical protein
MSATRRYIMDRQLETPTVLAFLAKRTIRIIMFVWLMWYYSVHSQCNHTILRDCCSIGVQAEYSRRADRTNASPPCQNRSLQHSIYRSIRPPDAGI